MIQPTEWLIDESKSLTPVHIEDIDRELAVFGSAARGGQEVPMLAVSLHDITIRDNKKWFGEADIRIDVLVITGHGQDNDPQSYYMPKTASFSRVSDGDTLPIGEGGLLVFHGQASHFLDIFIMVSRDRMDADNLANLLQSHLQSDEIKGAAGELLGLAVAAPQIAAVTAAIGAAAALGDFAYRLLRNATGTTIGLYRNSHLQFRDGFGVGPHPGQGQNCFLVKDLSFRYEIALEEDNRQE